MTIEAMKQEPVAWMYPDDYERMLTSETFCTVYSVEVGSATRGESTVPLYTTPPAAPVQEPFDTHSLPGKSLDTHGRTPQRQWVGTVDCVGLALDLEVQAKRAESQTVERAMLAAANGLRIIDKESKT